MKQTTVVESEEIIARCNECYEEIDGCDKCGKGFEDDEIIYCMLASSSHYCMKCGKKLIKRNK
jgi:predicted RNA-binding Zn-ribbon protein involved in translation (DUF1610 family)